MDNPEGHTSTASSAGADCDIKLDYSELPIHGVVEEAPNRYGMTMTVSDTYEGSVSRSVYQTFDMEGDDDNEDTDDYEE